MSRSTIGPRNYGEVILRARIAVGVRYLVLIVAAATMVFPILWVTLNAFRDNNQIYTNPFGFPHPVILTNFPDAFQSIHLWVKLANSVTYSGATVVITVLLASMTARRKRKKSNDICEILSPAGPPAVGAEHL